MVLHIYSNRFELMHGNAKVGSMYLTTIEKQLSAS